MSTVSRHPDLKGILDTWRAQELLASAPARIDQHRKGNLSIRVTRPDGSPAPDGTMSFQPQYSTSLLHAKREQVSS
jgi:hypothetical protein